MPKIVDHEDRRRAIAAAAVAAIDDLGLDAVRLVDVARRADCTTGAVSHYFPGKEAVLEAALEHVLGSLVESAPKPPGALRGASWLDDLIAASAEILPLDEPRRTQWRVWIAFCGRAVGHARLAEVHRDWYAGIEATLARMLIEAERADGEAAARAAATAVVSALDGIGLRATLEPDDWPPPRQRQTLEQHLRPVLSALLGCD